MCRLTTFAGLASLALLAGCQDYFFEIVTPAKFTEVETTVPAAKPRPADIIFVVDNSCSMADEQENLARNFNAFIQEIAGSGDYQIGIVTTDVLSENGQREGLTTSIFRDSFPNTFLTIDSNTACRNTGIPLGCFRVGEGAAKAVITSEDDRDNQIALFRSNILVGSCGDGRESGLDGMLRALSLLGPNECNAGFLRPDANLVVIIVSDEEDQAAGRPNIRNYVNELERLKPIERIRVGVIVGSVEGVAANCNVNGAACGTLCDMPKPAPPDDQWWDDGRCHSCSYYQTPDCCSADSGSRYVDFARAIEAAVAGADPDIARTGCQPQEDARLACLVDSICQNEFNETLKRIARDLISVPEYVLDPPTCNPDGVRVKVGDTDLPKEAFTVRNRDTLIITDKDYAPKPGQDVEIFFISEGCPGSVPSGGSDAGSQQTTDGG